MAQDRGSCWSQESPQVGELTAPTWSVRQTRFQRHMVHPTVQAQGPRRCRWNGADSRQQHRCPSPVVTGHGRAMPQQHPPVHPILCVDQKLRQGGTHLWWAQNQNITDAFPKSFDREHLSESRVKGGGRGGQSHVRGLCAGWWRSPDALSTGHPRPRPQSQGAALARGSAVEPGPEAWAF